MFKTTQKLLIELKKLELKDESLESRSKAAFQKIDKLENRFFELQDRFNRLLDYLKLEEKVNDSMSVIPMTDRTRMNKEI